MTIPFLDLGRLHDSIADDLDEAIGRVRRNSSFIGGREVASFEAEWAEACGVPFAVGCGSGTDAIELTLLGLGLEPGAEVIVPAMTFVATAEAVAAAGLTPVLCDVDPTTLLLTSAQTDPLVTAATKAVVPVHLYGHPVARADLERWQAQGLFVVEDAAQAHLSTIEGRRVGLDTSAACFSFFPGKNLGAMGDAGAVITTSADIAAFVRRHRDHGRSEKYLHATLGASSRLDGLQAAVLRAKLPHLESWTATRRRLADRYREGLAPAARLVPWADGSVHHLLVIRVDQERLDTVASALRAAGIATGRHYPFALSQQPSLRPWWRPCPNAELAAAEVLSLPIDPLMTVAEVDTVIAAVNEAIAEVP